jgi:membrane protein DedA with SNARE-associated domain
LTAERDDAPNERPRPSRRVLWLLVTPPIVLTICGYIGDATWAKLSVSHPLLLLALNPRNRNLVLVTNELDAVSYYVVGGIRLLLSDPLAYLIGYFYGDSAIKWIEHRAPTYGELLRTLERWFSKAAYPIVFVAPNFYMCVFAGASGMAVGWFMVLNVAGTFTRLYLVRRVGEAFESPLNDLLDVVRDYQVPLLVISVALVVFSIWNERRKGRGELEALAHAEEELEGE